MKVVHTQDSSGHNPQFEFDGGRLDRAWEIPERAERIFREVEKLPFVRFAKADKRYDRNHIAAVHDGSYVNWLERLSKEIKDGAAVYPSVFPFGSRDQTLNPKAQLGKYCFDTYTPIFASTYDVAVHSVDTALQATELILTGSEFRSYALCRPPGHHAEAGRCGGYCYFNNSAIAANFLTQAGAKVAVIDVDVHHGNGTQAIFWNREDIATVSIHCSPDFLYPYFSGFADETGTGKGLGKNKNFPLSPGTIESEYQGALNTAMDEVASHNPEFLVVALGVDTHETDPIGNFKLSTPYFEKMALTIGTLNIPTVVIQEGGYSLDYIGPSVASFLSGLETE